MLKFQVSIFFALVLSMFLATGVDVAESRRAGGQLTQESPFCWNIKPDYPLYKQCDPQWGNDTIITKTVCQVGCLMSSISMGLAGWGWKIDYSIPVNPGTLNKWLVEDSGYTDNNNLVESVLNYEFAQLWNPDTGMHKTNDLQPSDLGKLLTECKFVVANVMGGRHFVLVTGWSSDYPDTVWVNDPGYNTESYSFTNDIVGWRIFNTAQCC